MSGKTWLHIEVCSYITKTADFGYLKANFFAVFCLEESQTSTNSMNISQLAFANPLIFRYPQRKYAVYESRTATFFAVYLLKNGILCHFTLMFAACHGDGRRQGAVGDRGRSETWIRSSPSKSPVELNLHDID